MKKNKSRIGPSAAIRVFSENQFRKGRRQFWADLKREGIFKIQPQTGHGVYLISSELWSPERIGGESKSIITITRYGKPAGHLVNGQWIAGLMGCFIPFTKAGLRLMSGSTPSPMTQREAGPSGLVHDPKPYHFIFQNFSFSYDCIRHHLQTPRSKLRSQVSDLIRFFMFAPQHQTNKTPHGLCV